MISIRKYKVFAVFVLLSLVFAFKLSSYILSPCQNIDDCGKIVGWIFDSETNELVKEEFVISIIPYYKGMNYHQRYYYTANTKSGHFSISTDFHSKIKGNHLA